MPVMGPKGSSCGAEAKPGNGIARPPPGGMIPESAQPAGLSDQERVANLIRQCMAPLPTVGFLFQHSSQGVGPLSCC